jgi:hypothetical protein
VVVVLFRGLLVLRVHSVVRAGYDPRWCVGMFSDGLLVLMNLRWVGLCGGVVVWLFVWG